MNLLYSLLSILLLSQNLVADIISDLNNIKYVHAIELKSDLQYPSDQTIISSKYNLYEIYSLRLIENNVVSNFDDIDYLLNYPSSGLSYHALMIRFLYSYSVDKDLNEASLYLDKILTQNIYQNSFDSILITEVAVNLKRGIPSLYNYYLCDIIDVNEDIRAGCKSNYFFNFKLNKNNNNKYNLNFLDIDLQSYVKKYIKEVINK